MELREALFTFIIIVCSLSMVSWLVIAFAMKIAPKSSSSFATVNLLFVTACLLFIQRDTSSNFWVWNFCDLLVIYSLGLALLGVRSLFRQTPLTKNIFLILGAFTIIYLFIPSSPESVYWFSLCFSSGTAIMFCQLSMEVRRGVNVVLPKMKWFIIAWPLVLACLMMIVRLVLQVFDIATVYVSGSAREKNLSFLWFFVVLSLLMNLVLYSLVVSRLVIRIKYDADHDGLTNTINARKFRELLLERYEACSRQNESFSIILFDVDNFKQINDKYGHSIGDEALKHLAQQVTKVIKDDDIFARIGGEEFIILLPANKELFVRDIAETIRSQLENNPLSIDGKKIDITASFGYASSGKFGFEQIESAADEAMYLSKKHGKNCVTSA